MNRLNTALKNAAIDGKIDLQVAINIAKQFDQDEEESLNLIKRCKSWVGMDIGGDLRIHEAKLTGTKFSVQDFNYERLPGEQ